MLITVFREVNGPFSGRKCDSGKSRVCPNEHLLHPSWDICPYCEQLQQALADSRSSDGGGSMADPEMPAPAARP